MKKIEQIDLLTLLATNENAVSRLYRAYAEKTPLHEEFWKQLSDEEIKHADWIMELGEKVKEGSATVTERTISRKDVQESINEMQEEIDRVLNTGLSYLSHEEELEIALGKENSLIEKKFFKVMKTDDMELKNLLKNLKKETQQHFERIEDELKAEKKRN